MNDRRKEAIVQRFVDLELRALRSRPRLSRPSPSSAAEMRQRTERTKERLSARIDREVESKLLAWLTPSGKPLGACTGAECRSIGGWLSAVAEKVPAKATVAETLTEKQVYRLWQANAK